MVREIIYLSYYIEPKDSVLLFQPLPELIERIEIVTVGRAWILHEGHFVEVGPGDILWHVEGESAIQKSDPNHPYECLDIRLSIDKKCERAYPRVNKWQNLNEMEHFCHISHKEFSEGLIPKDIFCAYILSKIQYEISKSKISDHYSHFPSKLKKALKIIEKDYQANISIKELAENVQLSITHLHELFRGHLNTSPHQYLLKLKINFACQQLTHSTEPIKIIADRCGFSNASTFSRSFKHHKGHTPDEFRKKHS